MSAEPAMLTLSYASLANQFFENLYRSLVTKLLDGRNREVHEQYIS